MLQPVIELRKILTEELDIYRKIYAIEEAKSDVIMDKNGKKLEALSFEQERHLARLAVLEKSRGHEIDRYRMVNRLDDVRGEITLSEVVRSMDEDSSISLMRLGMDLKSVLLKLQSLQKTNEKLMNDSMEFYKILISGLRDSYRIDSGYGKSGREDGRIAGSVLIDHTA